MHEKKSISSKRSIAAHQSVECSSVRTKVSLHASQWAPGVLFPEAAKSAQKGTTRNHNKVSQPALIGQSQAGFCAEILGPAEVFATCLFPLFRAARILYERLFARPAGICGVTYNKKGDWGVPGSGLWFINLHSLKFQPNSTGAGTCAPGNNR